MKNSFLRLLALLPLLAPPCSAIQLDQPVTLASPGGTYSLNDDYLDAEKVDVQPQATKRVPPIYPAKLKSAKIAGNVLLSFVVDVTGKPTQISAVQSSNEALVKPAVESLTQWRFTPAQKDGHPVACRIQQPFVFGSAPKS